MLEEIISKAEKLPSIPFSAAQEYNEKADRLVEEVNLSISAYPDLNKIIGNNPRSVLYDNHNNHALFMSNIFKLNEFALMVRVIVWAYRTYHSRGFSFDYFPLAMRTWINAVQNNIEPSQANPLVTVYQWIIDNHQQIIEASREDLDTPLFVDPKWQEIKESFLEMILAGDHKKVLNLVDESIHSAADLEGFYLQGIQPAMYKIGTLWETGEISVAREHLASAIVSRVMASLYNRFILLEQTKGKAMVTAAPNEYHEIGPRMVADLLELDGWDVDYIGANVPSHELIKFVVDKKPFLLAISVSIPFNLYYVLEIITDIKKNPLIKDTRIMIGGHCIAANPQLQNNLGADGYGQTAKEAVLLADEWWSNA